MLCQGSMATETTAQAPLLIFDFDGTIIDMDSSEWVAEQLGAAPLFDGLRGQGWAWHQAMNVVLASVHAQGITIVHIRQALCRMPLRSATIAALRAAHAMGCELHIISDANTFFINSVLQHHGLAPLFSHVHSNPAWVDPDGRLCYASFHGDALPPHNCPLCPPNMCKGRALDSIIGASHEHPAAGGRQIIYAGDGSGDLCPSLRLSVGDCVPPRDGYPLSKLLTQHQVKACVHPWPSLSEALEKRLGFIVENGEKQLHILDMSQGNIEQAASCCSSPSSSSSSSSSCTASALPASKAPLHGQTMRVGELV